MFTATSTVIQFIILNTLTIDYALFLSLFTLSASIVAKKVFKPWFDRKGRKSLVVFALAGIVAISGVLTTVEGIIKIANTSIVTELNVDGLCK